MLNKKAQKLRQGFTLSEVLITLIVIGIISALVIPSIIYSIQKNTWVIKLKKVNSQLIQASSLIMVDNGGTMYGAFVNNTNSMMNIFGTKLSFVKTCLAGQGVGECWILNSNFKDLYGDTFTDNLNNYSGRAVLADGTLLSFELVNSDCTYFQYQKNGQNMACGIIYTDITGLNGPNMLGRDIFRFIIAADGLHAAGASNTYWGNVASPSLLDDPVSGYIDSCNPDSAQAGYGGYGCTGRVLKENGMNY